MEGIKHLIQCHCILPQYRHRAEPIFHKFVVFSVIDDEDQVVHKLAACNNCGAVHKVTEIGKSEILTRKEDSKSLVNEAELALTLPKDLVDLFRSYEVDLATWEEAVFIFDEGKWGSTTTLIREEDNGLVTGKILEYVNPERFRVTSFSRQDMGG